MTLVEVFYFTAIVFFIAFLVLAVVISVSLFRLLKTFNSILENVDDGLMNLKMGSKAFQLGLARAAWNLKKFFMGRRRRR